MDHIDPFRQRIAQIRQRTVSELKREKGIIDVAFELYARAFAIAKASDEPDQAMARMALASHNFNTLFLAADIALMGFYLQSLSLLRGVYENWIAFQYLAKFPQDAHFWLEAHSDKRPPKVATMRKRIDGGKTRGKTRQDEMYEILNRFVHTDPVIALSLYREKSGQPSVMVGVEFDAKAYRSCAYGISLWTGIMLDALSPWVPGTDAWHTEADRVAKSILDYLEEYNLNGDKTAT